MTTQHDPDRIEADYLFETAQDPERAAEIMAGEQSSGTFLSVPGETAELKERSAARVERLEVLEEVQEATLSGATPPRDGGRIVRARATLSWPLNNIGVSLPALVTTISGNLFELKPFSGLRLLDLRLPSEFAARYPGPKFGVEGTRRLAGVEGRPLIGTIIKPSIGLSAQDTGTLVGELAAGGIDFVKDDELQMDGPSCPFEARVKAVMAAVNREADRTGKKTMVAFNLTGEVDEMRRRHDFVVSQGGTCVMVNLLAVGHAGVIELARHSEVPIHAHRSGWGALTRAPLLGWSYPAWSKLWRLAGCDHMHVNGLQNKFSESDDSVVASARSLAEPLFESTPMRAVPVFSSGQTIHQAEGTWKALRTPDLIFTAGGGVMAHPGGPGAGAAALRDAWDAAMKDVPLETYAADRPALRAALQAYPVSR
ncbi:ribulose-bisphosphate carboxylase large subunit family protein [Frigidibacter sp. ROC022]|uniref:ribulose-bisphosphate carboxylase large subunit family protein n=1 Tax=Frigidibacter sp. ROC022 TaxID=2971796 RepID=UPI00215A7726|nr:ribulose-bisphosphate carboxylase large subunit family protein [Frigidibacter sp. ROC022]MCR8722777.1 ribulose-bisphosphate carboxylase large subunit family protein [Frigidibacter sp. ROC022]